MTSRVIGQMTRNDLARHWARDSGGVCVEELMTKKMCRPGASKVKFMHISRASRTQHDGRWESRWRFLASFFTSSNSRWAKQNKGFHGFSSFNYLKRSEGRDTTHAQVNSEAKFTSTAVDCIRGPEIHLFITTGTVCFSRAE